MQNDCIFCDIGGKGVVKKEQILEKGGAFNILLALHPVTRGHSLVVPREHYDSLGRLPENLYPLLFKTAINLGERLKTKLSAKAFIIKVNNELYKLEEGKGHVGHIHIHVVPRYGPDDNITEIPDAALLSELEKVKREILR